MLELKMLTKRFGGVCAVEHVDLAVAEGEILGLIGPNGSGKSTIVNLICGLFPVTDGSVLFRGVDITDLPPHARVALGIARTFQNIRLFWQLSVWQNLWVAQNSRKQQGQGHFDRSYDGIGIAIRKKTGHHRIKPGRHGPDKLSQSRRRQKRNRA